MKQINCTAYLVDERQREQQRRSIGLKPSIDYRKQWADRKKRLFRVRLCVGGLLLGAVIYSGVMVAMHTSWILWG